MIDLDQKGQIVGIDIQHASQILDLARDPGYQTEPGAPSACLSLHEAQEIGRCC